MSHREQEVCKGTIETLSTGCTKTEPDINT